MKLLLAVILVALCALLMDSVVLEGSLEKEWNIHRAQISVLYDLLGKDCPGFPTSTREIKMENQPLDLGVQKELYARLLGELNQCRQLKLMSSTTKPANTGQSTTTKVKPTTPTTEHPTTTTKVKPTTPTTEHPTTTTKVKPATTPTTEQPTTTTKVKPTTTATTEIPMTTTEQPTPTTEQPKTTVEQPSLTTEQPIKATMEQSATTTEQLATTATIPQPIQCQQAINYTQSWRRDYNGSDIKPGGPKSRDGYACDMIYGYRWFRFTGEAGNRMLDRCPKSYSCGTAIPYWTDAEMPKAVGVWSTVDVHGVGGSNCKIWHRQVTVMRCSRDTEHDFIYKQVTPFSGNCAAAFCGMM